MTNRPPRGARAAALTLAVLAGWSALAGAAEPPAAPAVPPIRLQPEGHFETPGFALLVYHNDYRVGRRGGLQAFLHGRRVFDAGEVVARGTDGKEYGVGSAKMGARVVDTAAGTATVPGSIAALGLDFRITLRTDGRAVLATVSFDKPVDWTRVAGVGLKLELFPEQFWHKSYLGDGRAGVFPERNNGPRTFVAAAHEIRVAPEDPRTRLTFASTDATLSLRDNRRADHVEGYVLLADLPAGTAQAQLTLAITPSVDPGWRRTSVLRASQAGYHPAQRKQAVVELDPRDAPGEVELLKVAADGGLVTVKKATPTRWGPVFDSVDWTFDFSEARESGVYLLRYGADTLGPFRIDEAVLKDAWTDTLDVYFPVQMCHAEVRQGYRIWRGRCHQDDARQAPPHTEHFDGYRQGELESPFAPDAPIPGLTWGGWHDAGDTDLPTGGNARTALYLALAYEEFTPQRDVTSVLEDEKRVEIARPDGGNDVLEQVSFGLDYLLGMYRAFGHAGVGVIDRDYKPYLDTGDPAFTSDNRPGTADDRWAFSNRTTGGQYLLAQLCAASARALRGFDDGKAEECRKAAAAIWEYEQTHAPSSFRVAYQPDEDEHHTWELKATAELLVTTGEARYRERLMALLPVVEKMPSATFLHGSGASLVRVAGAVNDRRFREVVSAKAREARAELDRQTAWGPYGVPAGFQVWGNAWDVLELGVDLYYFAKLMPELFDRELAVAPVTYTLGHHPGSAHSYVSGLGGRSATVAFGFNRSEYSYIPGGVVSGASFIRPKYVEYRDSPWDWYTTEYVMSGSAAYVFDVMAADALLSAGSQPRTR